jgi:hypothetical protein
MSNYEIDFTDKNSNRSFLIRPYTTNGPENPTSSVLDSRATVASTSLLLYGKGSPNYGERVQENLIHLLENFASGQEPVYPVAGQLWYNSNGKQLFVYNPAAHEIASVVLNTAYITGDVEQRMLDIIASTSPSLTVIDSSGKYSRNIIPVSASFTGTYTEVVVSASTPLPAAAVSIGDWDGIQQNNVLPQVDIDLQDTYYVINPKDPDMGSHVGDRDYNDLRYVNVAGDTMTGFLTLNADPTSNLHAATKQYVDGEIAAATSTAVFDGYYVNVTGDAMIGNLSMGGNEVLGLPATPSGPTAATSKQYVDAVVAIAGAVVELDDLLDVSILVPADNNLLAYDFAGSVWRNKTAAQAGVLSLSGGTMTGYLTLSGDPIDALHAVPNQYLEQRLSTITGGTYSVVVNGSYNNTTGALTFLRSDGSSFQIPSVGTANNSTSNTTHINNPPYQSQVEGDLVEEIFGSVPTYPSVPLDQVIQSFSEMAYLSRQKNPRHVFTATGAATYALNHSFVAGFNDLQVYVKGVKQITDERGYQAIIHSPIGSPSQPAGFYPSIWTGLPNDTTSYDMDVTVDGGAPITVSVQGQDVQTFAELVNELNSQLNPSASAFWEDGSIIIASATTGSSSSISISSAVGSPVGLVAALIGETYTGIPVWSSSATYSAGDVVEYGGQNYVAIRTNENVAPTSIGADWRLALEYNPTLDTPVAGATYGYSENGLYGQLASSITFATDPTGAVVETIAIGQQRAYART